MIKNIYYEQKVENHDRTQEFFRRFPQAAKISCNHFKEVFNPSGQNFRLQKKNPSLILASQDGKKVHPLTELKMTILLWVAFIIFTKMGKVNTIIVFTCLCLHYLVSNFYKYYKDNNINDYNNIIEILDKSLVIIIFVSTIIGFISYVIKEKREHKRFSWYKFFIGVDHC